MINLKSHIFAIALGSVALSGTAHAVELGIPSQAITEGVGWENTGGINLLSFPANGSTGFTAGSFDSNGGGPGGTYTNNNFVEFPGSVSAIVRSGSGGAAFQSNPLALSITFDYNVTGGSASFGLSNDGTSLTTVLSSALSNSAGPQTVSFNLNSTQLSSLNSSTTFAFSSQNTLRFSNFRFDVTPVPFEFNPALGVVALAGVAAARKLQKTSKKAA
ncbi:MAG: hypothetical protein SFT94_08435 [Pseudanabaenaceae cyanobacterium bins.68]|nr:hypothetical protein [Pseudanabaenaceae cyanobacterium bins.68]